MKIINPFNGKSLVSKDETLVDQDGNFFPVVRGVARICPQENYSGSFGFQWNKFDKTQLDRNEDGLDLSKVRFFAETAWNASVLNGQEILEVGSGAGRFSKVILDHTKAYLYSVDYSDAVSANFMNNGGIAPERFSLFQASVYDMPFEDDAFDKVFCLGVLQHTPDFEQSVACLINKAKPGGEIVVDWYPINGWWTKLNAKYLLRPLTKKMDQKRLMALIEANIDWLISVHFFLHKIKLGFLTRFLPVCNVKESFPSDLSYEEIREWSILDTFDQYSPEHDHPQRLKDVIKMFEKNGAKITFAGVVPYAEGGYATVVRALKSEI